MAGNLKHVGVLSVVEELWSVPGFHSPLLSSWKWGCLFSFSHDAPRHPSQMPNPAGGSVWAHPGFPFACGNSTWQRIRIYFYNRFWIKLSLLLVRFFTPDLVPLNRFHVIAKPANDHVCIVLWGKGKSSRAKRPKSSPSGTHSGHSSVAHLLQLVSTKKKAGGGGREKKKKTLVMFTDFCGRISGAF